MDVICLAFLRWGKLKLISSFDFILARCVIFFYTINVIYIAACYSTLFYIYTAMTLNRVASLTLKTNMKFSWSCVCLFRQMTIFLIDHKTVMLPGTASGLIVMFLMLVLGINATNSRMLKKEPLTEVIGATMPILALAITQTTFFLCCHIFEDSKALIDD